MIVTQIIEVSKNRSKVYIDQEFAFVLYKGELCLYHLQENSEIAQEDYQKILDEVLPKRAKLRAMNLLQKKTYTEKQLRDKLKEGYYPEEIIEDTMEYVKSFHYINDYQYVTDYIEYHSANKSIRQIEQDLYRKGIDKETFRRALSDWEADGGSQDELDMLYELLEKRHYSSECDKKEKQKIYAFLLRKGYGSESIMKAMRLESF